jgi:DNA-binding response OmpR family regulator
MTNILLVEDDLQVQIFLERVLADAGYKVDTIGRAEDGCELLRRRAYGLVPADARLPDGTGMAVADEARENGTNALVMTGYGFRTA